MRLEDFAYDLPSAAIAQTPLAQRDGSRLLVSRSGGSDVEHTWVADLPDLLGPGDVLVVNNSRVIPARLALHKTTGGAVEVFLLSPVGEGAWEALVRPSRRVPPGTELVDGTGASRITVGAELGDGRRVVSAASPVSVLELALSDGEVPLPPYINEPLADVERYQTVYAARQSSVAAPTAGLHFTPALLEACEAAGARLLMVELAVGLGTFRPILVDDIDDHAMHAEYYTIDAETWRAIQHADRVVAVGTTSARALESAARSGELSGDTDLFIKPGYEWQVVDALLTNFHQPRSSLLVMLASFIGDRWRELYGEALDAGYRFLSFGDAMFVERSSS